jgi:hypothetical protein
VSFLFILLALYFAQLAFKGLQHHHQEEVKRYQKSMKFKYTDEEIDKIFSKYE